MADTYSTKPKAAGVTAEGTFAQDELVVQVEIGEKRTIVSGAGIIQRGTVLGKITASGKLTTSLSAASDGSQTPYALAAETVDATSADADTIVYLGGTFNSNKLILGTGHTLTTVYDPLRQVDIHLVKALTY
jgi:hypothetical protein